MRFLAFILCACSLFWQNDVNAASSIAYTDCKYSRAVDRICVSHGEGKYDGHKIIYSIRGPVYHAAIFLPSGQFSVVHNINDNKVSSIDVSENGLVGRNMETGEYYPENKNYNNTLPEIRSSFLAQPNWKKKVIQRNLQKLELYGSKVDGLWGRNTYIAILAYNALFKQTLAVSNRGSAGSLLTTISLHTKFNYRDGMVNSNDSSRTSNGSPCISNVKFCSDAHLCRYATTNKNDLKIWDIRGEYSSHVKEAKRRNLSCGVSEQTANSSPLKNCANDPNRCGAVELCQKAVEIKDGARSWRKDSYGKQYVAAAKSVGLTCNVESANPAKTYRVANGTGFYISDDGYVVTNQHVIDGCNETQVHSDGQMAAATIVGQDKINDLALLKTALKTKSVFSLAPENPYLLQDIIAAGFPFGESISSTIKVTKGVVSSLSGLGDNSGQIQIDAALQPGNSGGPIIDENGNVVGVAVAKLDLEKSIESFGVVPENVNFGIKLSSLKTFLEDNNVAYKLGDERPIKNSALGKLASEATVLLSCWMTEARIETMQNQKAMFKEILK